MIELMQKDSTIPNHVMENLVQYHDARKAAFEEKYGDWMEHNDEDIDVSDDEIFEQNLPAEEESVKPTEETTTPADKRTVEEVEAELLDRYKKLNKIRSVDPDFQPCVFSNPLRIKERNEEIMLDSFHRLKTEVLKQLLWKVVGSTYILEAICAKDIEKILSTRKGEDSKLDKKRRQFLNAFLGRRFKMVRDTLKFRVYIYEQEGWMDLTDMDEEKELVEGLKKCFEEALKREEEAKQFRKANPQDK